VFLHKGGVMTNRERLEYDEYMDNLLLRVGAVLDGERAFDVAGIGFAIIMQAMEGMPPEGQERVKRWIQQYFAVMDDRVIH
jgi:hypothetical protein